ncbi:hypothetical protein D9M71_566950 [compost metagenome]
MRKVRLERYQSRPTGLAEFLGRVSGVNFLRHKLHHYQDAKRIRVYLDQHAQLKARQSQEAGTLAFRLKLQTLGLDRQSAALEKVDKRELSAFMRDQQQTQRIRARGKDGVMPSLDHLTGRRRAPGRGAAPDVMAAFEKAQAPRSPFPDVMAAFDRAAAMLRKGKQEQREGEGPEKYRPTPPHHRKANDHDRER